MIKNNKLLIITVIFFILIILMSTIVMASNPIDNPDIYDPSKTGSGDITLVTNKAKSILGTISTIGIVVSVITLTILGIKYMVGSVSEKAEYKKSMVPYIVGVVLLISTSAIVGLIATLTKETIS